MGMRTLGFATLLAGGLLQLGCDAFADPSTSHPAPSAMTQTEPPPVTNEGPPILTLPPEPPAPPPEPAPLFAGKTVRAAHTAPVVGGTLLVTRDGSTVVAADPDRDAIFLVNLASHAVTSLVLSRGDEPGRMVEGPDGTLFVALRRAGALLSIDLAHSMITQKVPLCASPRGVAYDAKTSTVHVACRSGQLLSLDAATLSRKRTLQLDTDLRDVIVREHDLVVTRFTSAEVMLIADDGSVSRRASPQSNCGDATVMYRAMALPDGQIALAHQVSSNDAVGEGSGAYGGSSCGGGLVSRVLSTVDPDTASDAVPAANSGGAPFAGIDRSGDVPRSVMTFRSFALPGAGPLDVAFDAKGARVAAI